MPYNEHWRRLRTIVHQLLTPKMSATFKPSQLFESKQLTYDILHHNEDLTSFYQHCRRVPPSPPSPRPSRLSSPITFVEGLGLILMPVHDERYHGFHIRPKSPHLGK